MLGNPSTHINPVIIKTFEIINEKYVLKIAL